MYKLWRNYYAGCWCVSLSFKGKMLPHVDPILITDPSQLRMAFEILKQALESTI